jgi:hypothetical protein
MKDNFLVDSIRAALHSIRRHELSRLVFRKGAELELNYELCNSLEQLLGDRYSVEFEFGHEGSRLDIAILGPAGTIETALEGKCFTGLTDAKQFSKVLDDAQKRKGVSFPIWHVLWVTQALQLPARTQRSQPRYVSSHRRERADPIADSLAHVSEKLASLYPKVTECTPIVGTDEYRGFRASVVPYLVETGTSIERPGDVADMAP